MLPFSAVGKRKWPRIGQFFCQNCVLYARTNHEADFLYALMPRGTPFLDVKKGGEEASGGNPPESPGGFVDFLSMKIDYDHVA